MQPAVSAGAAPLSRRNDNLAFKRVRGAANATASVVYEAEGGGLSSQALEPETL